MPPHNGVGDWCLKKVRCEVARIEAHRHYTARSSGHRPDGTSVHPDRRIRLVVISCRQLPFGPGEGRAVAPAAGHDDSQFSRCGNDGFLLSPPRDQPHCPCFEWREARDTLDQDVGRFIKQFAHGSVTAF